MQWTIDRIVSKGEYNYAVVLGHPAATRHGYVLEHRVVMENHLGRLLTQDEVVHHKNGDKKDNRLQNLELTTACEHARSHMLGSGNGPVRLVCAECGVVFERAWSQRPESKKTDNVFCSRSCNGKFQKRKELGH